MSLTQKAWPFLTAFLGALAGASIGSHREPVVLERCGPPAAPASAALGTAPPGEPERGPVRASLDPEERAALAGAVAAMVQASLEAKTPRGNPAAEVPRTPASVQAHRDAEQLLARAQETREWTERDLTELRKLMPAMHGEDQERVLLALMRAVNEGQMAVRTHGPAF